jgi:hydrogenase nickel incorporation protein HypA/HybF
VHELAIVQDVVDSVVSHVGGAPVKLVVLEIGSLSGVAPEAVRYCFGLCTEDTSVEGAILEIIEVPGIAHCRSCGGLVELDRFVGFCRCGSTNLDWQSGDELKIARIELV